MLGFYSLHNVGVYHLSFRRGSEVSREKPYETASDVPMFRKLKS